MSLTKWYAASVILYLKYQDNVQDSYPVLNKIILIEAETIDQAWEKAEKMALKYEGDDNGTLICDGRRATRIFAGLREMISCDDTEERPTDGTELTFFKVYVDLKEELERLANNEPVHISYNE